MNTDAIEVVIEHSIRRCKKEGSTNPNKLAMIIAQDLNELGYLNQDNKAKLKLKQLLTAAQEVL